MAGKSYLLEVGRIHLDMLFLILVFSLFSVAASSSCQGRVRMESADAAEAAGATSAQEKEAKSQPKDRGGLELWSQVSTIPLK
eukprot:5235200-Amphidinium_carterae.1